MDHLTLDGHSAVMFIFKMFIFKTKPHLQLHNLYLKLLSFLKFYGGLDCQLADLFVQMLNKK